MKAVKGFRFQKGNLMSIPGTHGLKACFAGRFCRTFCMSAYEDEGEGGIKNDS